MDGVFNKLKSLFIIEDESQAARPSDNPSPENSQPTIPAVTTEGKAEKEVAVTAEAGKVNDKLLDLLFQAMQQSNIEGFDYLEFRQSLQSLAKMPMDEATRYQAAFSMAQTMGVTPQKLVDTATRYLNILKSEQQKFGEAMAKQQSNLINNREAEQQQLEAAVTSKTQQIQQLTKEIAQHQQQIETIKKEISDAATKIENTKNNFEASYSFLVGQINDDVSRIKQYLVK